METGIRVPTLGFITGGTGESNLGIPPQEYETFAYDSALLRAGIQNFNVMEYTSVLPKELHGNIHDISQVSRHFHHGGVLEVIMAGTGAAQKDYAAIATGIGICWARERPPTGRDCDSEIIGGFAAEFVQRYTAQIDAQIAQAEAHMWLTKSLTHELKIRKLFKHGEVEFFVNWTNISERFGYCLTALGFLNFMWTEPIGLV